MERFRPNVCIVLTDAARRWVLVFRRVDSEVAAPRWQFPQGGLHSGESPQAGALRELREEIGTDAVQWLAAAPQPVRYRFPEAVQTHLQNAPADAGAPEAPRKGDFAGQEQHWLLGRLLVDVSAIRFDHEPPEFDGWQWVTPQDALRRIVPFKQAAYQEGLRALGLLPQEDGAR